MKCPFFTAVRDPRFLGPRQRVRHHRHGHGLGQARAAERLPNPEAGIGLLKNGDHLINGDFNGDLMGFNGTVW